MDENTYTAVLDGPVNPADFDETTFDIYPSADPTATSQTEKLLKAQGLMELLPLGIIDPVKVVMRILDAQQQPNWQDLIPGMAETGQPQIPQKQDPAIVAQQQESLLKQRDLEHKQQLDSEKAAMDQRSKEFELNMEAQRNQEERQHTQAMNNIELQKARNNLTLDAARGIEKLKRSNDGKRTNR